MLRMLLAILPLLLIYLALTANIAPGNILLGVLLAGLVIFFVQPGKIVHNLARLPQALWALVRFLAVLVVDIIKSGVVVAQIVLSPHLPIYPGIIRIPTQCSNDLGAALSAYALTVTPGEITMEISEDGELFVHCLDVRRSQEYVHEAQVLRQELLSKMVE
jgi:multicomponent Na+:H+ antiporter subunit E